MVKPLEYKSLTEIQHALQRPDTLIGSVIHSTHKNERVVEDKYIVQKDVDYAPGLIRLFVEILSNVIDNKWRSDQMGIECKQFRVTVNKETGVTSVWNDGNTIPVEKKGDVYLPQTIFGQFRTSSNYDDEEKRKTSGRNGLGSKVVNIFSTSFTFKTFDRHTNKNYSQKWTDNMTSVNLPRLSDTKKKPYTLIEWIPDFKRFGVEGYTDDIIALYQKYTYDAVMISGLTGSFNGERVPIKKLSDYAKLYSQPEGDATVYRSVSLESKDSKVIVCPSPNGSYGHISFVNGIQTRKGGVHVDTWNEVIFRPLVNRINKKFKTKFMITDILKYFNVFLVSEIDNPSFSSQTKEKLTAPRVDELKVPDSVVSKFLKWDFMDDIQDVVDIKKFTQLKKGDGKKSKTIKVEGYDRANKSGGSQSCDCTLILSEGLSAKTYAVDGIGSCGLYGKKGRDWFGVYALRGKVKNVSDLDPSNIEGNKIISHIIKIVGLKYNIDYSVDSNYQSLNYGRIVILCDADLDGIHIKGLIINYLVTLYPSLVTRSGFLQSMETPITKVSCKTPPNRDIVFYDINKYNQYQREHRENIKSVKYYKGLGASTKKEIKETFGKYMISYDHDVGAKAMLNVAFGKKQANTRKTWLSNYKIKIDSESKDASKYVDDDKGGTESKNVTMTISDFINNVFILYSREDCHRSIPCVWDGLKESQRKILYSIFKKNLIHTSKTMKVAQLAGYIAEQSGYHHGENNLMETLVKMAQEFPGRNNIPYLYQDGQFGTRTEGGKDSANGRYIFTRLRAIISKIYRKEDFGVYSYIKDDGVSVEPEYYIPIIPTILVNGITAAIGTGWSCTVPNYNPGDIIDWIREWCDNRDPQMTMEPWFKGFTGTVSVDGAKITTTGVFKIETKRGIDRCIITELPVNVWTVTYKEFLEKLVETRKIKSFDNHSTPDTVSFTLIPIPNSSFTFTHKNLRLEDTLSTSNMYAFTGCDELVHFSTVYDILHKFCEKRIDTYTTRKAYIIKEYRVKLLRLTNKYTFVKMVYSGKIKVFKTPVDEVIKRLKEEKLVEMDGSYKYLLGIPISAFTTEEISDLHEHIVKLEGMIRDVSSTSEISMWTKELDELEVEYRKNDAV